MDETTKTAQETADVSGQAAGADNAGKAAVAETGGKAPETAEAVKKNPETAEGTGNRETSPAAGSPAGQHTVPAGKESGWEENGTSPAEQKKPEDPAAREEELRKREESLARRELELEAKGILKKQGISETMLPYLLRGSLEETESCIQAYKAAADADLKARLDERLTGKAPPQSAGHVTGGDRTTADVFASALRG